MDKPTFFMRTLVFLLVSGCATGRPPLNNLIRQLRHSNPEVRVRAMGQLSQYGTQATKALPYLAENFRDRREPVNRAAENAIIAMKEPGAQALGSLLSDKDSWVRCRAAGALGRMPADAPSVVPALVEALRDRDFCVSEKAAIALGAVGEPAVPALLETLKSNNATARKGAAQALGSMGPEIQAKVGAALLPSLLSKDEFVRGEAAMRITHMGKIGIPVFLAALKEPEADLRQRAVDGLGEIGIATPEVVDAFIGLFKDSQQTLRLKASVVLGRLGQKDSFVYERVAPQLTSKDKLVLLGTMRALGDMGGVAEPSLPQIVFFMEESPDPDLRNEAAESLIKMGTTASLAAAEKYTRGRYNKRHSEK
ncbi:MAG: HEAT repeat domain-containing protein [Elusimicrobia bacterium]|nr:HEAT repeat domain-containing protein [Elusimicrobiota bacterium]